MPVSRQTSFSTSTRRGHSSSFDNDYNDFAVNTRVEARYRGGTKYYSGRISKVNNDGTYNIEYDDGDKEVRIRKSFIRKKGGAGGSPRLGGANRLSRNNSDDNFGRRSMQSKNKTRTSYMSDQDDLNVISTGSKVQARFKGKAKWYDGTVIKVNRNGTYDIEYDDGDVERMVKASFVKVKDSAKRNRNSSNSAEDTFRLIEKIVKNGLDGTSPNDYRESFEMFDADGNGSISSFEFSRALKTMGIQCSVAETREVMKKFDTNNDGNINYIEFVSALRERASGRSSSSGFRRNHRQTNSTFSDSDTQPISSRVGGGRSKPFEKVFQRALSEKVNSRKMDSFRNDFEMLDMTGRGKVSEKDFIRTILRQRLFNRSDAEELAACFDKSGRGEVSYQNFLNELENFRPGNSDIYKSDSEAQEYRRGDRVEARYKGGKKYYKGSIIMVNKDQTYDIRYDDGDMEKRVRSSFIKPLGRAKTSNSYAMSDDGFGEKEESGRFFSGDKVEARYKGGKSYYPGTIKRARRDGTFDIRYDDGDEETGVKASFIRSSDGSSNRKSRSPKRPSPRGKRSSDYRVNDNIEARYRGGKKYYKGKIKRINPNGTYDILYADGDSERQVDPSMVRLPGGGYNVDSEKSDSDLDGFSKGSRVQARHEGSSKYNDAEITRVNPDGTFDIIYDNGDRKRRVRKSLMRRGTNSRSSRRSSSPRRSNSPSRYSNRGDISSSEDELNRGDRIEARYRGGKKFYSGKILRDNRDNTYDIQYDDGDSEQRVKRSFIRKKNTSFDSEQDSDIIGNKFSRGDRVEARYKGGKKFYKGKISRVNADGTYAVQYNDGDSEARVRPNFIRLSASSPKQRRQFDDSESSNETDETKFQVGDKIEARYKGKMKYYSGRIIKVNSDGTYAVKYDDGDSERRVAENLIRNLSSTSEDDSDFIHSRKGKRSVSRDSRSSRNSRSKREKSVERGADKVLEQVRKTIKRGVRNGTLDDYRDAFELFDEDNNGRISRREFRKALRKLDLRFTTEEFDVLTEKLDTNNSGQISYKEFLRFLNSKSPRHKNRRQTKTFSDDSMSVSSSRSSHDSDSDVYSSSRGKSRSRSNRRNKSKSRSRSPKKRPNSRGRSRSRGRSNQKTKRSRSYRSNSSSESSSGSSSDSGSESGSNSDDSWGSGDEEHQEEFNSKKEEILARMKSVLSKDSQGKYKKAFKRLDKNNSGKINSKGLCKVLKTLKVGEYSVSDVKSIMNLLDHKRSGKIKYRELVRTCRSFEPSAKSSARLLREGNGKQLCSAHVKLNKIYTKKKAKEKEFDAIFTSVDTDDDDKLSKKELKNGLKKAEVKLSEKELNAIWNTFETNDDKIQLKEFLAFCKAKFSDKNQHKQAKSMETYLQGLKALRESREEQILEGEDPIIQEVVSKMRKIIQDALSCGIANDYREIFEMFDADKSGQIDTEELGMALEKLGFDLSPLEIDKVSARFDKEGKGKIDYRHFLMFCTNGSDREKWVISSMGNIKGNTYIGELEAEIRQKIRKKSLKTNRGQNTLISAFKKLDSRGSGYVLKRDLKRIASKFEWSLTNEDINCLMARFDGKGNDKFSYKNFINFLVLDDDSVYGAQQRIRELVESIILQGSSVEDCFKLFDRNGDGKITEKELSNAMMRLGFPVSEHEVKELIRRVDVDRDGKINLTEFRRAFATQGVPRDNKSTALTEHKANTPVGNLENISNGMKLVTKKPYNTNFYYDWTQGMSVENRHCAIPLAPEGSVGHWIEQEASVTERNNFFSFLNMITMFENRLGLQQKRSEKDAKQGQIVLQLGTKLQAAIKFIH